MDTVEIIHTLSDVRSFLGVYASDMLPHHHITKPGTVIVNADSHDLGGSHWLAIHIAGPRYAAPLFYFDSYGVSPFVPTVQDFLRRNAASLWDYNRRQLQGLHSSVCGQYCCLFARYMDLGYSPQHFIGLFNARDADRQVCQMFRSHFGHRSKCPVGGGQHSTCLYKVSDSRQHNPFFPWRS